MNISEFIKKKNISLYTTNLDCSSKNITSLEGIEVLTDLEILDCSFNRITSLEWVDHLDNLKWLNCSHNRLTSLKGIEGLKNLKLLYPLMM